MVLIDIDDSCGTYLAGMLRCALCRHQISAATHEYCRSHALCARGVQYWGRFCHVCGELWERARDLLRAPEDALFAWSLLRDWIDGFIKNSRNRVKGKPVFACRREKEEYDDMAVIMANVAQIPALDYASPIVDSSGVSSGPSCFKCSLTYTL